jgi:hypothetical protein
MRAWWLISTVRSIAFSAALIAGLLGPEPPDLLPALHERLTRFSEASVAFITKTLTPTPPKAEPIDPTAAAKVDEDLDYRIAAHTKTAEAWRAFLDAHPNGPHTPEASAALGQLEPPPPSPPPAAPAFAPVVEVANATPQELDLFAALERPPAPMTKIVETTVVKWREREPRTRYVVHWRYAWPRHYRAARPQPSLFTALFGDHGRPWRAPPRSW